LAVEVDARPDARSLLVLAILRYLDVPLVILAIIPVLALRAPLLGYFLGAGGWLVQRVIAEVDRRWTRKVTKPVKQLGVTLFEAFGRIWLLAGVLIAADLLGGRRNGLTAALVICGAYTVAFAIKVISGPPSRTSRTSRSAQ